ncbi:tryptophan 2,3-dioxygenase family protein, partial [Streptomyces sp. NPDC002130]|uniref:tryptophan 2,3-dioxygenase family protein n=1 Tax=Streptomyces sp. NPDC002130 TaxID=3155568 RepID=UPI00332CDB19
MKTPYACYLRLVDLLDLQRPRTPEEQPTQWADEHFFITVHQSAEVLASQALVDLHRATDHAHAGRDTQATTALRRVTALVDILEHHLALLDHLRADSFACFRPLLDNASGAQSSQFAQLFHRIAAPDLLGPPTEPQQARTPQAPAALQALRAAVVRWQTRHLLLVERMIGDQPGTGGTSGLAHLRASTAGTPPRDTAWSAPHRPVGAHPPGGSADAQATGCRPYARPHAPRGRELRRSGANCREAGRPSRPRAGSGEPSPDRPYWFRSTARW